VDYSDRGSAPVSPVSSSPTSKPTRFVLDHTMPEGVVAKAFAVTLENEAGSDKPISPILISGEGE